MVSALPVVFVFELRGEAVSGVAGLKVHLIGRAERGLFAEFLRTAPTFCVFDVIVTVVGEQVNVEGLGVGVGVGVVPETVMVTALRALVPHKFLA